MSPEERPPVEPHVLNSTMIQLHQQLGIEDPGWSTWL